MEESEAKNKICPDLSSVFMLNGMPMLHEERCRGSLCAKWEDWGLNNEFTVPEGIKLSEELKLMTDDEIKERNYVLYENRRWVKRKVLRVEGQCGLITKDIECN